LLTNHAACVGSNGDVNHSLTFYTLWIAPAEIDSRRCSHVQREPRHEQIIVCAHSALHGSSRRRCVLSDLEACRRCSLDEVIADHHLQRS